MKTRASIILVTAVVLCAALWLCTQISDREGPDQGFVARILKRTDSKRQESEISRGKSKRDRKESEKSGHQANYYTDRLFSTVDGASLEALFDDAAKTLPPQEVSNLVIQCIKSNEKPPDSDLTVRLIENHSMDKPQAYAAAIGKLAGTPDTLMDLVEKMPPSPAKAKGYQRYFLETIRDSDSLERAIPRVVSLESKDLRDGALRGLRQAVQVLITHNQITRETAIRSICGNNPPGEIFEDLIKDIGSFSPQTVE